MSTKASKSQNEYIAGWRMYKLIVIGVSAGGMQALSKLLPALPNYYKFSVAIVQHIGANNNNYLPSYYSKICQLPVSCALPAMSVDESHIYFSPSGHHLLVENDRYFNLLDDDWVNQSRPLIDVLFDSAADAFCQKLIAIILTGARIDGSKGLLNIKIQNRTETSARLGRGRSKNDAEGSHRIRWAE